MFMELESLAKKFLPLWKDFLQLAHRDRTDQ